MSTDPSYVRKADWAEKHLVELSRRVLSFMNSDPYEVTDPVADKHRKRSARLQFTAVPDPDIALIAGDVIYNLRAAFDYLIGSLVPSSYRSKALCPVLHEPVWDIPPADGENEELKRSRGKWNSLTSRINSPEAIEALKELMPFDSRARPPLMHPLDVINWLSNKDRHQQVSVIAWGLGDVKGKVILKGGTVVPAEFPDSDFTYRGFKDGADIPVDDKVVYVKLRGTPVVVIRVSEKAGNLLLPYGLLTVLEWLRNEAIAKLGPYSRAT